MKNQIIADISIFKPGPDEGSDCRVAALVPTGGRPRHLHHDYRGAGEDDGNRRVLRGVRV
jgi:hypothetical protein